jgi:hypothetical protein
MTELKSFDLRVHRAESSGYIIEAMGPNGERALATFVWTLMAGLAAGLERIETGMADRATMERVGSTLFQGLFPQDVLMVYVAVKAQLDEDEGLRLRLHVPPELTRLPWELLYDPPQYLSTDPRSPVVRFLDLPAPPRPLAVQPPLRLLYFAASPVDAPSVGAEREAAQLRSALADLPERIEIVSAPSGTLAALRDGLRQGCHVLHFSGHGGLSGGEGFLLLEDQDGHSQPVDGAILSQLLRGTDVRLVVLGAGGSAPASEGHAFGSVATALVRSGVPAAIAHHYTLPAASAIPFAGELYRALVHGDSVDTAVTEGRKAIVSHLGAAWRDRLDWAVPVLYMRTPDGHILTPGEETGETRTADQRPRISSPAGEVSAPQIVIGDVAGAVLVVPETDQAPAPWPSVDLLRSLLDELGQLVSDHVPEAKRAQALDQVAALKNEATQEHPEAATLESVQRWFEAELPSLSGAVLSAILAFEFRADEAGDETLLAPPT